MGCAESREMPLKLAVAKRSLILNLSLLESPSSEASPGNFSSPTFRKLALRTLIRYSEAIIFRSLYIAFKSWKRGKLGKLDLSEIPFGNVTFTDDTFNIIYPLKEADDLLFFFPEGQGKQQVFEARFKPSHQLLVVDSTRLEERIEIFTFSLAKKIITQTEQLIGEFLDNFDKDLDQETQGLRQNLQFEKETAEICGNDLDVDLDDRRYEEKFEDVFKDFKNSEVFNQWIVNFSRSNLMKTELGLEKKLEAQENEEKFSVNIFNLKIKPLIPALDLEKKLEAQENEEKFSVNTFNLKIKPLIPALDLLEILEDSRLIPEFKVMTKDATMNTSFSQRSENIQDISSKTFKENDSFRSFNSDKISPDMQAHPSPRSLSQMLSDSASDLASQETESPSKFYMKKEFKIQKKFKIEPQTVNIFPTFSNQELTQITPLIKNITLPEILEKLKSKQKPPVGSKSPVKITVFHRKSPSRSSGRSPSPQFQTLSQSQQEKTEHLIKTHKKNSSTLTPLLSNLATSQSKDSPLPLNQVLKIFEDLMDKKYALDQKELKDQVKPRELAEFFPDYLNRNFGIQKVGQRMLSKFLLSLKNYSNQPYVKLLCRFLRVECEEPVTLNLLVFLCKARNDFNNLFQVKNLKKKTDDKSFKVTGGSVQLVTFFSYLSKEFKDPEVFAEVISRMCPGSLKFEEFLMFYSLNKIVKSGLNIQVLSSKDILTSILNSIDFTLTDEQLTNLSSFVLSSDNKQMLNRFSFSAYKSCRYDPRYSITKCEFLEGLIASYETLKNLAIQLISQVLSNYEVLDRNSFISVVTEIDSSFSHELKERLFDEGKRIDGSEIVSEHTFTRLIIQSGVWKLCYFHHKQFNEAYKARRVDYADLCIKPSDAFDLRSSIHRSQTLKTS